MKRPAKKRASLREYKPQNQLTFDGFESPYGALDPRNRWVKLCDHIPWDALVSLYNKHHPPKGTGRPPVNPRVLIGSVIIKHLNDYDDRETIEQIRENIYLQYFLGFEGFSSDPPFDASLFVDIRKKLTPALLQSINERLLGIYQESLLPDQKELVTEDEQESDLPDQERTTFSDAGTSSSKETITHQGELLMDATVAPQDIAYPTDLNLLNDSREMSEKIIDFLYLAFKQKREEAEELLILLSQPATLSFSLDLGEEKAHCNQIIDTLSALKKPRIYRKIARKDYLNTAQSKKPSKRKIRLAVGKQLRYLRRNLKQLEILLDLNEALGFSFPLPKNLHRYYWVIQLLYDQQLEMFEERKHKVDNRLVSIHQPHVRPIVRGKAKASTEFGAKIHLYMIDKFAFLDTLSWDAFNEGTYLRDCVESYKSNYGYYPEKVLVDKIYANRENRKWLKEEKIKISAKPLGRPSAKAVANHIRPGERNPIEGKFGQAKVAYGMNRIRARLQNTSESWIASIILVLNLVNLARVAPYALYFETFSTRARLLWAYAIGFKRQMKLVFAWNVICPPIQASYGRFLRVQLR